MTAIYSLHYSLHNSSFFFFTTQTNPKQKMATAKESVILFPSLGMGHLIPMVELAKLFLSQGFSVTIIVVESPYDSSSVDSFVSHASTAYPSISFHRLPKVTPPSAGTKNPAIVIYDTLRLANPNLLEFLRSTPNVKALIVDMFCTAAIDVANELGLASYIFFASAASTLAVFLLLPTLQSQLDGSFRDLGDSPVHVPGLPPIPASALLTKILDRDEVNEALVYHLERLPSADGIMINTFESLEERAVKALLTGVHVPGRTMPPLYCIGPLVVNGNRGGAETAERHECLTWLDKQPEKSVVFLCFGSAGSFSEEQLKEMANGLEKSGQRFLWVVRSDSAKPEPDLEVLLPEGFLKRTEGRGIVVKSWAPQAAVLGHASVGGFVSHCGWNSTLEALTAGVPMIAWPLYAEQRMNKVYLVDAELAVAMEVGDKGLVTAEEVKRKVKLVMESKIGKAMREQAVAMKEKAVVARKEDGSSTLAWQELVVTVRKNGSGQKCDVV